MVCIYCGGKTSVINSRLQRKSNQTWRRRQCLSCKAIFSTLEKINFDSSLSVKARSGALAPFSRDKLYLSIYSACGHRKDAKTAATALTDTIIGRLLRQITNAQLEFGKIIEASTDVLKRFDRAAAVQYRAYHPAD